MASVSSGVPVSCMYLESLEPRMLLSGGDAIADWSHVFALQPGDSPIVLHETFLGEYQRATNRMPEFVTHKGDATAWRDVAGRLLVASRGVNSNPDLPQDDRVAMYLYELRIVQHRHDFVTSDLVLNSIIPLTLDQPRALLVPSGASSITGITEDGGVVMAIVTHHPSEISQPIGANDQFRLVDVSSIAAAAERAIDPSFTAPTLDRSVRPARFQTPWGGQNLVGLDADGSVHVFWTGSGTERWRVQDLTRLTGSPAFKGEIDAYTTAWNGITIVGTTSEGRVGALWWSPSLGPNNWQYSDMSGVVGATEPFHDVVAFTTPWGGMNIATLDAGGNINVFWWTTRTGWLRAELPAVLGDSTLAITNLQAAIAARAQPGAEPSEARWAISIVGITSEETIGRLYWDTLDPSWSYQHLSTK